MKVLVNTFLLALLGVGLMFGVERVALSTHHAGELAAAPLTQAAAHPYRPLYAMADTTAASDAGSVPDAGSAVAAPAVPDPLGHPGDTASSISKLYHSGQWVPLFILVLFCALKVLDSKVAWFEANSKRAAYMAAGLGVLAALAAPASQGTTPNLMTIVAAITGPLLLLLTPAKKAA